MAGAAILSACFGPGQVATDFGNGTAGFGGDGGAPASAMLNGPSGVAYDSAGNAYIADTGNCVIRKVVKGGNISTIAGTPGTCGYGGDGGAATSAELNHPMDVEVTTSGVVYVADRDNQKIRSLTPNGANYTIATYAGANTSGGSADGNRLTQALFNRPSSLALAPNGNLYVADRNNNRIRLVAAATGAVTTIAGGASGNSGDEGPATSATLSVPSGLAIDSLGDLYVADTGNCRVRYIDPGGTIHNLAGSPDGTCGYSGDSASSTAALLRTPTGLAVHEYASTSRQELDLYISDTGNNVVRLVTLDNVISTVVGTGVAGYSGDNGPGTSAQLNGPTGLAINGDGNLSIADTGNNRVRLFGTPTPATTTTALPTSTTLGSG